MEYKLCDDTWDTEEIEAIHRVIQSNRFSMGEEVKQYEKEFAEKFGTRYAVMVSSGSAANLLAIAALVYSGKLKAKDEVIVPAVSWSTTYFPLFQMGLKLRFVDIDRETLNIDVKQIRAAITPNTKMIFAVNLLGNPNEFEEIFTICKENNIIMIEDNCESLGAMYQGKQLGTLGLLGTYSTFYSHHLCTMEGGMVVTEDEELYHYMLCIRAHGWTRNLPKNSSIYTKTEEDFYESFNFIVPGFNLRPLEMEAAIGRQQLKKMDEIIANRQKNAVYFKGKMQGFQDILVQKEIESSSWFGFSVLLQGEYAGRRNQVVKRLSEKQIEVRPIVAGNFVRNKAIHYMDYSIAGTLRNADDIHENGFFIGNHSKENRAQIEYFIDNLKEILLQV